MIYMVGGAPRAGKSILGQRVAAKLGIGWISTDLLEELLRLKHEPGVKTAWDASPAAIASAAEWFFPYLERFTWGVSSKAEGYVIEGVDFLPAQVMQLSTQYALRAVFLGRSSLTLEQFDRFPGRSKGYASLPDDMRQRIVRDVPLWSEYIRLETERFGLRYFDMSVDFPSRLAEAEAALLADTTNAHQY